MNQPQAPPVPIAGRESTRQSSLSSIANLPSQQHQQQESADPRPSHEPQSRCSPSADPSAATGLTDSGRGSGEGVEAGREPSRRSVMSWQLLVATLLSTTILCLHSQHQLLPISTHLAQAWPDLQQSTVTDLNLLPVIPAVLYPQIQGARLLLPLFRQRWLQFSSVSAKRAIASKEAVSMARFGFIPEVSSVPIQYRAPPMPQWSHEKVQQMIPVHQELLDSQIIHEVPEPDFSLPAVQMAAAMAMCYYGGSPFLVPAMVLPFIHVWFTVPKPHSKELRPVSGMKGFNQFVIPRHFKMEGLHTVRQMLQLLDFCTVIDLKAAYPTMGISPRYRDYFIFQFRGKYYRYSGAVFGISSLPRAFTKLLRPVIALLRSFGIRLCIFLDDILVMGSSFTQCAQDTQDVLIVLTHLGFVISTKDQVQLIPNQSVVWCGALICSRTMQFLLPPKKLRAVRKKLLTHRAAVLNGHLFTLRRWASILGLMRSTLFAILPALLWSQAVRRFVCKYIRTDKRCWNKILPAPPLEVLENLRVFAKGVTNENGRSIRPTPVHLVTESDASGFGGGITTVSPSPNPAITARWHWTELEKNWHINRKELVTHLMGLQALDLETPGLILNKMLVNKTDNSVSMSYVNRQGGRVPALSYAAEELWYWLLGRGCVLHDQFIAGKLNTRADTASRWWIDVSEYRLLPQLFQQLHHKWGPFTVDAFATRANCQLPKFWSRYPEPNTSGRDAFLQDWRHQNLWLFPPYPMIPKVLTHLRTTKARGVLVAPLWTAQSWFHSLLEMVVHWHFLGPVTEVTEHPTRSRDTNRVGQSSELKSSWNMVAFQLSGNIMNSRDTVQRLLKDFYADGRVMARTATRKITL